MSRIVCIGEAMVELAVDDGSCRLGFAGDTLNTAIHLARLGRETAYFTALGKDRFSRGMLDQWAAEGLDTSLVLSHPERHVGLYAITLDETGERSFTYWRDRSAAREMFAIAGADDILRSCADSAAIHFSLITLAILAPADRQRLLDLAETVRTHGGRVSFDGNYRARLWSSVTEARQWRDRAIAVSDVGFPSLDDEVAVGHAQSGRDVLDHWQGLGCSETVVKLGEAGCLLPDGTLVAPSTIHRPRDTSGAGDAFDAGYLAARLSGASSEQAAHLGQSLAGWTVMRAGAIPARDDEAPYSVSEISSPE